MKNQFIEQKTITPETFHFDRLVKGEDLNHHKTLFAGRSAEWFVEAGFIAVASILPAANIVCVKIHGMEFSQPIYPGEIARFESRIAYVGRTSVKVHITIKRQKESRLVLEGFITFVHVNEEGRPVPHHLELNLLTPEDQHLYQTASTLR
jgi:acyl-CoA hydrolase